MLGLSVCLKVNTAPPAGYTILQEFQSCVFARRVFHSDFCPGPVRPLDFKRGNFIGVFGKQVFTVSCNSFLFSLRFL